MIVEVVEIRLLGERKIRKKMFIDKVLWNVYI